MKKLAFLFSASEYLKSRKLNIGDLSGVKYDILALEKRFSQIGFDVIKEENTSKSNYIPTIQARIDRIPSDAISIVYFSGHGGHCNGKNYIFPSDFGPNYDVSSSVDDAGINIEDIISLFGNKGRLILILDSCRTDDLNLSTGNYSEMTFSENVYIAYGTMFAKTSTGIKNKMSWFTEAICDEVLAPNIDIDELFTRVRQNIYTKHKVQIPPSVNALLDKVVLHSDVGYTDIDKAVHQFVEKYGDEYTDKYGYFHGDDLIFIDAAQYFDMGLLDAIWSFRKTDDKIFRDKGVKLPELPEAESKLVTFLGFNKSEKYFVCDEVSHTWYYNGRQIRMGEIPPVPPSMQRSMPEDGKALQVTFMTSKVEDSLIVDTNIPDECELFVWSDDSKFSKKYKVEGGKIVINNASNITLIKIETSIFTEKSEVKNRLGKHCRNLVGEFVIFHPIHGNQIKYTCII